MTENDEKPPVTRREFLGKASLLAASAPLTPGCTLGPSW